ncbi:MAG: AAA family ATPase [Acidobacteria bacterium]|nr:AAA family ATPase [Acidobacteriota bacterium]
MYEKFYGLREPAFNLTPDPTFLFLNKRSKDALDQILYGIERREGFAVIVGDIGTGKTTMCWALLERLARKDIRTAMIQNPMLSELDILRSILQDFGVRPKRKQPSLDFDGLGDETKEIFDADWMEGMSKKQLLDRLNMFLAERAQENVFSVLIVDEAQNVSTTLLEQLRLLSNLETAKKKLIQIIFVGQLELNQKLKALSMRQLNQRISVRFETKTLSREDTERYIRHRLAVAGGAPRLRFGSGTFRAVWRYSRGYPRMINLICDRALLAGYAERAAVITPRLVRKGALALKGLEDAGPKLSQGWFRRLMPFLIPAVFLLSVLLFALSKSN